MEPITIIMIVIGALLLVGSCFLPEKPAPETNYDELIKHLAKRELTPEEIERLRQTVDRIVSEKTEEVILKTDDYLSRVANEKIMSVDEFSKEILERLNKNNSDVMFLYNMLTETKEDLKTEITSARKVQEALQTAVETQREAERAKKEAPQVKPVPVETAAPQPKKAAEPKKTAAKISTEKKQRQKEEPADKIAELVTVTMTARQEDDMDVDLPKEKILKLHKKGKTVREISRELGMGQGEVKLVIDLYGA
ncbi:MAG: hypothetical protein J1E35_05760 [Lachnospiraceae bacterium]|nr:hypothetical protein [Lachnospiraceae bacterium]